MREGFNVKYTHELADIEKLISDCVLLNHIPPLAIQKVFEQESVIYFHRLRQPGEWGYDEEWRSSNNWYFSPREVASDPFWKEVRLAKPVQVLLSLVKVHGVRCAVCSKKTKAIDDAVSRDIHMFLWEKVVKDLYRFDEWYLMPNCICDYCGWWYGKVKDKRDRDLRKRGLSGPSDYEARKAEAEATFVEFMAEVLKARITNKPRVPSQSEAWQFTHKKYREEIQWREFQILREAQIMADTRRKGK